jgi:hypothetical protein
MLFRDDEWHRASRRVSVQHRASYDDLRLPGSGKAQES